METVGDSRSSSKEKRSFEVMSKPLAKKRKKIFYPPLHVTNLARMNQSKACNQQLDGSNVPRMKIKQKSQSHSQQHVTSKLTKTKSSQRHKVQEEQRQRTKHLGKNHMQVKTRSGKARKDPQKLDKNKLMEKGKELENIESENEDYEKDFMESDHEMIREDEEREVNVDEEIREDEQREVDDDEDEEIREDEQREVQQPKNHRGPTKCLKVHERGVEARPVVILDKFGVPIGPTDNILNELSSFLGTLGRNPRRTPLDKNWHDIGKEDKDSLWEYVKEKYSIADSGRKWTLQTINSAWRRWKCLLKRQYFTGLKNDGERWKKRPKTVPKDQFRALLKIWHSQNARKASEKNKETRNSQTLLHTAGSKSFARIRRDMEKELNRPPTDAEVFLETRKKKKKAQPEKTLEMIDTLEQLTQELTQEQTEGENVDAWHLVNKKEHPGRVRLRGRAITQSMLQSNKEKAIDPCDQVPESIVQAITKKVVATQQEEMKRQQEAQATSMIQTFADMLSEVTGRPVSPSFVDRFKARTKLPEEAASVLDHEEELSFE